MLYVHAPISHVMQRSNSAPLSAFDCTGQYASLTRQAQACRWQVMFCSCILCCSASVVTVYFRCSKKHVALAGHSASAHPPYGPPTHSSKLADMAAAPMSTIRQALDSCLLIDNEDFCNQNPLTEPVQSPHRRNILAMQLYLRLFLLAASKGRFPTPVSHACLFNIWCLSRTG